MESKVTIRRQCLNVIESAVYILILEGVVVYVGESKNPYSRLGAHVKDTKKRFDTIRILPCAEHRRKYWEAVLIDRYQPLFNSKGKDKETNQRHIFELGMIKQRQHLKKDECENCKRKNKAIVLGGSGVRHNEFAPSYPYSGYPITSAATTTGSVFMSPVLAPDEEYAYLAHQEKEELENKKKEEAYNKKILGTHTLGYITNLSTSITDPETFKKLMYREA
tara:strand:- start:1394 stop:2056 length:663 start_codon:yes stop_codon:yes gene_type:complete